MNRYHRVFVICITLMCAFLAAPALAFVDPPVFTPAQPNSQQAVTASVTSGVCHLYGATSPGAPPLRIEREGMTIRIISPGISAVSGFCNGIISDDLFDLGVLQPGQYEVEVWMVDAFWSYQQTFLMSSAPLTVTAAATPTTIPSSQPLLLTALAGAVALLAIWTLRRHASAWSLALVLLSPLAARAEDRHLLWPLSDAWNVHGLTPSLQ